MLRLQTKQSTPESHGTCFAYMGQAADLIRTCSLAPPRTILFGTAVHQALYPREESRIVMNPEISRREALKRATRAGTMALAGLAPAPTDGVVRSPIRSENAQPGTRDWLLSRPRVDPATKYRCPWIEGYCSHASARVGETVRFFVSTNPLSRFTIQLYRLGYYGGAGGRLVRQLGPFTGRTQPEPEIGLKRLRDCRWEPCAELLIPSEWVSGVYIGKLTAQRDGCPL